MPITFICRRCKTLLLRTIKEKTMTVARRTLRWAVCPVCKREFDEPNITIKLFSGETLEYMHEEVRKLLYPKPKPKRYPRKRTMKVLSRVEKILRKSEKPLYAKEIYERLPEHLRPLSPQLLGLWMKHSGRFRQFYYPAKNKSKWWYSFQQVY